ncbi:MAG: hypothetical protein RR904_03175 [Bacilli bacterium]
MLIFKILSQGYTGIHIKENLVTLTVQAESITRIKNEKKVKCMEKVLSKRLAYTFLTEYKRNKILKDHYLDLV